MLINGQGVPQDAAEAAKWNRKAAEQGSLHAQHGLGFMFHNGLGVSQDHAEAVRWYRRAAEQGHASAQSNLGAMYSRGLGVEADPVEAHKWFTLAAASEPDAAIRATATRQRDAAEKTMTRQQVTKASQQASAWQRRSWAGVQDMERAGPAKRGGRKPRKTPAK